LGVVTRIGWIIFIAQSSRATTLVTFTNEDYDISKVSLAKLAAQKPNQSNSLELLA
jgi:hypothetical protein